MFRQRSLFLFSILFIFAACSGGKTAQVTPALKRIDNTAAINGLSSSIGLAGDANSDLDIQSLEVPILGITLSGTDAPNTAQVYICEITADEDCLVDLADGQALQNLLGTSTALDVDVGTYDTIQISTCTDEEYYTGYIKATGELDGSTYKTKANSSTIVVGSSGAGKQAIKFRGCSRQYPIPGGLTLEEGESFNVNLFFDLTHIAFFSLADAENLCSAGGNSVEDSACGTTGGDAAPDGPFVGVNYLDVVATVNNDAPDLELFFVEIQQTEAPMEIQRGVVGVIRDAEGNFIGGYTRSSWKEGVTNGSSGNGFVTPVREFSETANKYVLENYASESTTNFKITINFTSGDPTSCTLEDVAGGEDFSCDFFTL
jgi:hypothetical protein